VIGVVKSVSDGVVDLPDVKSICCHDQTQGEFAADVRLKISIIAAFTLLTYRIDNQATAAIGANSLLLDDFLLVGKVEQLRTMSTVRLARHRFSFAF
jgi:hypothetical protein